MKLIIEVDGGQHIEQGDYDAERTGYTVLRFWNNEIMKDIESVMRVILNALESRASSGKTGLIG